MSFFVEQMGPNFLVCSDRGHIHGEYDDRETAEKERDRLNKKYQKLDVLISLLENANRVKI